MVKKRIIQVIKWLVGILLSCSLFITAALYFFKDEIIAVVLTEVNEHLKAKVKVEKIDLAFWSSFPNLSVDFKQIFVQDTYEGATVKDTLLYTEKIRLRFNPLDIWRENYQLKQIDIYPGALQLKVNPAGEVNYDVFKESKDTTTSEFQFDLQKIKLDNFRFSYTNKQINHRYATDILHAELDGKFSEKVFTVNAKTEQFIRETKSGELNFTSNKKALLDIRVEIDQNKGTIVIPPTKITIANLPFHFSGFIGPDHLNFLVEAKKLKLTEVAKNFTLEGMEQIKTYSGSGEAYFSLKITDNSHDSKSVGILCDFGVKNGNLTEPTQHLKVSNLNVDGLYSNNGGAGNDYLELNNIRFLTQTGPFNGHLRISELEEPRVVGNFNGDIDLAIIHSLYPIPSIAKVSGNVKADTDFDVKVLDGNKVKISKSNGTVQFFGNSFQLQDDKRDFHSINGIVTLKDNDVNVSDFTLKTGATDLTMNGYFSDVIGFFSQESKLLADVNINSNRIKIEDLGTESKEVQIQNKAPRAYVLPNKIAGKITLSIGQMTYEDHLFEHVQGQLSLSEHSLNFTGIRFNTSGASVSGAVSIKETSEEYFNTVSTLNSERIQLKQLMKDWKNFKQDVIKDDNISGFASVNLYLEAPFDWRNGISMKEVKSDVRIKIEEGRLSNVSAFNDIVKSMNTPAAKLVLGATNIQAFGDKLKDLRFETLENTFRIQNGVVSIPAMKINSSAINIDVNGTHTTDNVIDYRFAFNLRDIKMNKSSEFGEIIDDNTGLKVYLKMYGNLANPQFAWDKDAKAADRKEYNEIEKKNIKSMLKTEFGLFKNDSTVQKYEQKKQPKEVIEVEYGTDSKKDEVEQKQKKEPKKNNFFKRLENEENSKKKVEVEFD